MDKNRTRKLRQYFPDTDEDTRLVLMGASQRLVINGLPLQLIEYDVGDNQSMYAAYSKELNVIYIRLIDSSFFSNKKE